jgi:putative ABC transport system permease protein
MSLFREIRAVTALSVQSIPERLMPSLAILLGVATVVAVFISILAMADSYRQASTEGGRADRAVVLSAEATTEFASNLPRSDAAILGDLPGIRRDVAGQPIVSFEVLSVVPLAHKRTGEDSFVTLRGIGPSALAVRPEIHLVAGRMFRTGTNEVIAGRAVQARIAGIELGDRVDLPQGECVVVGTFASGGDSHESELHMDVSTLSAAIGFPGYHSATVMLESAAAFETFTDALTTNPTLTAIAKRESEHFADASRPVSTALRAIAWFVGAVMTFGAVFGLLNIMYSSVSARQVEIATLRALGFHPLAVVLGVLAETLLLALTGSGFGAAIAWLAFNGDTVSIVDNSMSAQLTYSLQMDAGLVGWGVATAFVIGLLGGWFPAMRASRLPVAQALRGT